MQSGSVKDRDWLPTSVAVFLHFLRLYIDYYLLIEFLSIDIVG